MIRFLNLKIIRKLIEYCIHIEIFSFLLMNLEESTIKEIQQKQIESCPSSSKISIVCSGYSEDPNVKSTFYDFICTSYTNGNETTIQKKNCYKELHDFNRQLKNDYGSIRMLKTFPNKHLGKKDDQHIQARMKDLQNWLNELVSDAEACEDPVIREYFGLPVIPKQNRIIFSN